MGYNADYAVLQTCLTLGYIQSPLVQPYFFLFSSVWVYLRHYMNLRMLYSIVTEFQTVGPFDLNLATEQYKCWISQYVTFSLLAMLQALNLFWFFLILRIAYNIVVKNVKRDVRSDGEDEDEDDGVGEDRIEGKEALQDVSNASVEKPVAVSSGVETLKQEAMHGGFPASGGIDDQQTNGQASLRHSKIR